MDLPAESSLRDAEAFEREGAPALELARERLEEMAFAGGLLLIERAFARHPFLGELAIVNRDGEVGFELSLRGSDGSLSAFRDVWRALDDDPASRQPIDPSAPTATAILRQLRRRLHADSPPEILANFPGLTLPRLRAAEVESMSAQRELTRGASRLLSRACPAPGDRGILAPGPAALRAAELGLPEVAALLERAAIGAAAPAGAKGGGLRL